VQDGKPANQSDHPYFLNAHPRTAVGLDASGRTLILIVVDGRQTNYSIGATMAELAQICIDYGAVTALNMDGGGSAVLVMQGADGNAIQMSAPIHNGIPYRERPIANHLGIYALPLDH
jgi:exopolysaccharide biosynthesis protein